MRPQTEIEKPLPAFSVESIYYDEYIQRVVATRKANTEGGDAEADLAKAKIDALAAIARQAAHLCRRRTETALRHHALSELPSHSDLAALSVFKIEFDVAAALENEKSKLSALTAGGDLSAIFARYPVRESGLLKVVAKALRFITEEQYETAVIAALVNELLLACRKIPSASRLAKTLLRSFKLPNNLIELTPEKQMIGGRIRCGSTRCYLNNRRVRSPYLRFSLGVPPSAGA